MRILVTGNAGFIGSHLSESLVRQGHSVYGIDDFDGYYDRSYKDANAVLVRAAGVNTIEADLATADLAKIIDPRTDVIYHCAAQPGISGAVPLEKYKKNNLVATERLLATARHLPHLAMFVYLSTSSVYGTSAIGSEDTPPAPASDYGRTKLAAERLVLSYARDGVLPACAVRPFSIYGERERPDKMCFKMIEAALDGAKFPLYEGSLEHRRSFTYVGDLVAGLVSILDHIKECNGQVFNMGNPESVPVSDVVAAIEALMGVRIVFEMKPRRAGDQMETRAVIAAASHVLGFSPHTPLVEGLRRQIEWQKARRMVK